MNISIISKNLLTPQNCAVTPRLNPTVEKAEIVSKRISIEDIVGSNSNNHTKNIVMISIEPKIITNVRLMEL